LAHEQNPLSNDTIDSVLRHREVVRAKDLSAPPRMQISSQLHAPSVLPWKNILLF